MSTDQTVPEPAAPSPKTASSVPLAARALVLLFLVVVPFRIVSTGWLPGDDALRHAATTRGLEWDGLHARLKQEGRLHLETY